MTVTKYSISDAAGVPDLAGDINSIFVPSTTLWRFAHAIFFYEKLINKNF